MADHAGVGVIVVDRIALAGNPSTPVDVLTTLASDPVAMVRAEVVSHPSTPVGVLTTLAADSSAWVREWVAHNATTPATVLSTLASDPNEWVRAEVARNAATPVGVLTTLAADSSAWVREWVAQNATTPATVLATLAADPSELVRSAARATSYSNRVRPGGVAEDAGVDLSLREEIDAWFGSGAIGAILFQRPDGRRCLIAADDVLVQRWERLGTSLMLPFSAQPGPTWKGAYAVALARTRDDAVDALAWCDHPDYREDEHPPGDDGRRLRFFGYWKTRDRRYRRDPRPSPEHFVDMDWSSGERHVVADYLRAGRVLYHWVGSSTCRICGLRPNGNQCLTDGTYGWPSGLAHLVESHGVRPPREFVEHVLTGDKSRGTVDP